MTKSKNVMRISSWIKGFLVVEFKHFPCVLPDKFVAGGIIAKLPPSWKDFATSLKHKRQWFSVVDLIGTLDVEERARAKDTHGKGVESSSANVVQEKNSNFNASHKKKKEKKERPKKTTNSKKKKGKESQGCFVCGGMEHWVSQCPYRKFKQEKKPVNMINSEAGETSRYGNLLPTVLSVCKSPEWWIDTDDNVHVCADISLFSSY
jgi:hypothetical protein